MIPQLEDRKDLFEVTGDLQLLTTYRSAILAQMPRMWICILYDRKSGNYGLEVNNLWGSPCSEAERVEVRGIISNCRAEASATEPVVIKKRGRKKEMSS